MTAAVRDGLPLRGQLRIAINSGVTKNELGDFFIHLVVYGRRTSTP
jgi:alkylhydroperoxidase/carboxymuconolactone decarboxylase family protein YurZ